MAIMAAITVPYHARGASILTWIPQYQPCTSRLALPVLRPRTCLESWRDSRAMCSQDSDSRRSFSVQVVANSRDSERRHHFLRQKLFGETYQSRATLAEQASVSAKKLELQHQALALPLLVLPLHLTWFQQPLKRAAWAAGVALAMWRSIRSKPGPSLLQGLVRSEACLSWAILVVAPILLRSWAKLEVRYHDTLECRTVLQTYLIAASGGLCATLAAIAGHPISAALLQVIWRGAAARSLWTWVDLGKNLRDTPGWLHASLARWRIAATYVAVVGAAARFFTLVAGMSSLQAMATALSSPMVDFLPLWFITAASTPDEAFRLNAAELALGVGLYAWIAYYLCVFLPYRVLFVEYQDYGRRLSQFWKDLQNGQEHNVIFSTKLGPGFPKHLSKRMAKMPPGDDHELLQLAGVIRQRSCSQTVVKAAMLKKNKEGKYGVKMTPIEPGDLTYWGSDLFKRLEQQEKRDEETGWTPPVAPGKGRFKHIRATYARILREIKVELGKTDVEMEHDPLLSLSNLVRFDPDAEQGDFDLVVQKQGSLDVSADAMRMKPGGHEMVMMTDEAPEELDGLYADRGLPLGFGGVVVEKMGTEEVEGGDSELNAEGHLRYNRDDPAVNVLEESIRSTKSSQE